jgi:hypothetical protein
MIPHFPEPPDYAQMIRERINAGSVRRIDHAPKGFNPNSGFSVDANTTGFVYKHTLYAKRTTTSPPPFNPIGPGGRPTHGLTFTTWYDCGPAPID